MAEENLVSINWPFPMKRYNTRLPEQKSQAPCIRILRGCCPLSYTSQNEKVRSPYLPSGYLRGDCLSWISARKSGCRFLQQPLSRAACSWQMVPSVQLPAGFTLHPALCFLQIHIVIPVPAVRTGRIISSHNNSSTLSAFSFFCSSASQCFTTAMGSVSR